MVFIILFFLVRTANASDEEKMPAPRLATFFGRLLAYDTNLKDRAKGRIDIAVLYRRGGTSPEDLAAMTNALQTLELTRILDLPVKTYSVAVTNLAELEKAVELHGIDAFIVSPGLEGQTALITQVSERRKVIALGLASAQARAGFAVAVYLENKKSKILVNLSASKLKGAAFSSDLLRLSEVIP